MSDKKETGKAPKVDTENDMVASRPVPEHQTWGGGRRNAAAGGPAGRGNEKGSTDPTTPWSTGEHGPDPKRQVETRPGVMGKGAEEPTGG